MTIFILLQQNGTKKKTEDSDGEEDRSFDAIWKKAMESESDAPKARNKEPVKYDFDDDDFSD